MLSGVVCATPTFQEFNITPNERCMDTMSMKAHLKPQHFLESSASDSTSPVETQTTGRTTTVRRTLHRP